MRAARVAEKSAGAAAARRRLKRAAAMGIGGGGWVGERGRDWAGAGTRLLAEAKNDKEKLARELQAGATQPAKRGVGAGC